MRNRKSPPPKPTQKSPKNEQSYRFTFRVSDNENQQVRKICRSEERTPSQIFRLALKDYLNRAKGQAA